MGLNRTHLKYLKGLTAILVGCGTPWEEWAANQMSLRAAIIVSVVAFATLVHNWVDHALADPKGEPFDVAETAPSPPANKEQP